jgi:2,4-dienoyl-CoA reductase-like NADH-dependent reductase (Old Yellow Enzyme family)
VSDNASHWTNVPGIYTSQQMQHWKVITDAVHAKGGIIYTQIWMAGRADVVPSFSASAIPLTPEDGSDPLVPRALETSEIPGIVELFRQAAVNAIEAGFDGVEIHGANGYLLDQFLQSNSNKRTDQYGGSVENRARILLEIIESVSNAIGQERVGVRFSPYGGFQEMYDENPVETFSIITQLIQDRFDKLAYLHFLEPRISGSNDKSEVGSETLEPFHKIWKGVFLRAGGHTLESASAAAQANENDVLVFGRHFISNPDLPLRLQNGWDLNQYQRATFYTVGSPVGYIDYPFYQESKV